MCVCVCVWCVCVCVCVCVSEGTLSTITMAFESRATPPCTDWWRTSNTWPWDNSRTRRNRGVCVYKLCIVEHLLLLVLTAALISWYRIKSVQKMEGLTNGMGLGLGHQQGAGLSDISTQVHLYQQFLGKTNTKCRSCSLFWIYNLTLHQLLNVCVSQMRLAVCRSSLSSKMRRNLCQMDSILNTYTHISWSTESTVRWVCELDDTCVVILVLWWLMCVCVFIGDSGRDGKPAVPSCGDALEEFLEVQWRTKQRHRYTRPVRHIGLKCSHKRCDVVLCLTDISVSTVMMNQRSVCPSRFWFCCVNMSPSSTGPADATIYCTKA